MCDALSELPGSVNGGEPSPKSQETDCVVAPVVPCVTAAVKVTACPGCGFAGVAVIETVGCGRGLTVIDVVVVVVSPSASVPVTTTRYEPARPKACDTAAGCPVIVATAPSPQSTLTLVTGLAVVLVPYVIGSVTVWLTIGVAGVGVPTVIDAVVLTLTITLAVCADVVVGGGVPVPPPPPVEVATPAVAVTVVVRFVVNCVVARPFPSVLATVALNDPVPPATVVSIANVTGTPGSALPLASLTLAVSNVVPPVAGSVAGLAARPTLPTAAAPIRMVTAFAGVTAVPPEMAVIEATPEVVPAMNVVTARPVTSVSTSGGSKRPRVVVKVTRVPSCGGVPACSTS